MTFKLNTDDFTVAIVELIRRVSTRLPSDVQSALQTALAKETPSSPAAGVLEQILENVNLATSKSVPVCQDTGTNIYNITIPKNLSMLAVEQAVQKATSEATLRSYLRPNMVDPVSGRNSGNNLGRMAPLIHFMEWERSAVKVELMLKGGGSENVSAQYSLPDSSLDAGRDLNGVFKCVVDAVHGAQGLGCAPGIIGIGIGGDRVSGMVTAKEQLFRNLTDSSSVPELAELEQRLYLELNTLGIGPMGLGGKTTVLGVKAGLVHRLPASYFVSIAYMCWACRRGRMIASEGGAIDYD